MRFLKIILFIFCFIAITNCTQQGSQLHDTKGNVIDVSKLKGKWIILNFWAAWCDSCMKEIPEFNRFYQHHRNKNIEVYGVNFDQMPMSELKTAMEKMHIAYPVILENPAQTWQLDEIDALPVTYIIDPNGKVVKKILGTNTEQSLQTVLHELQKVTSS